MKSMPWENPQQYIARSPVFFADKVKTPTMVLTGEEDWRTPIAQSEEFYFALKSRGVDTVLCLYNSKPLASKETIRAARADLKNQMTSAASAFHIFNLG